MKPVIIIAIAFVLLIPLSVLAQSQGATITAIAEQDSKSIIVYGKSNPDIVFIIFTIKTPSDDRIVAVEMAWLDSSGAFDYEFNVDSLWDENGFYKIYADTGDPLYDLEISVEVIDGLTSETNITESNLETGLSTTSSPTIEDNSVILQADKILYEIGDMIILTLIDLDQNQDENSAESYSANELGITLTFNGSPLELSNTIFDTLMFTETTKNLGIFQTTVIIPEKIGQYEIHHEEITLKPIGGDSITFTVTDGMNNSPTVISEESLDDETSDICSDRPFVGPMSWINFKYTIGFAKLFTEYKTSEGFEEYVKEIDYQKSERSTAYVNSIISAEEFAVFYFERNLIPEEEKLMIQISEKYLEFLYDGKNQLSSYVKTDYSEKKNEIDNIPMQDSRLTICGFDKTEALEELEEGRNMQKSGIRQIVDPVIEDWEKNLELKQSKFPTEFPKEKSIPPTISGKIGLKKGDWVKYEMNVDGEGLFGMVDMMKSTYEFSDIGCTLSDTKWTKFEIIEMNNNNPTVKSSIFCNGEEHEHPLAIDSFTFIQYFIPIDVKIGDVFTSSDREYEVMGFETKYFDGKNTEVIRLYSEQIELYDNDGKMKMTDESFFAKDSGLLLEKSMSMEANNIPFFGDTSLSVTLDAIDYNTPRTILSQPSGNSGGGCLIATATYGSELAPQVQMLREIRDNSLLQTESGSAFMESFNKFYYSFSPAIADYERQNPVFKEAVKLTITPLINSLAILNYVDIDSEEEVLGYGIGLILMNIGMYIAAPIVGFIKIRDLYKNR